MPKDLNILITGASRGIGNAIAKKISSRANKLFLTSKYSVTIDKAVDELKHFLMEIYIVLMWIKQIQLMRQINLAIG